MARCDIRQIYYSAETRALLDPGFTPLPRRPDDAPEWREYASFRQVLKDPSLDEATLYGVLSPRFGEKTRLTASDVIGFTEGLPHGTDVVLFSPYIRFICGFQSVLHQGESLHPGLMAGARALFQVTGQPFSVDTLVNHTLDTVFCNFFLARPAFWRRWFALADVVLDLDPDQRPGLGYLLSQPVAYRDGVLPMSIFVLERIASVILALEPHWKVAAFSPFRIAERWSPDCMDDLVTLDAHKLAFARSRDPRHLDAFHKHQRNWLSRAEAAAARARLGRA